MSYVELELGFAPGIEASSVLDCLRVLNAPTTPALVGRRSGLIFELRAEQDRIVHRVISNQRGEKQVRSALRAHLPAVRVGTVEIKTSLARSTLAVELRLDSVEVPLRADLGPAIAAGALQSLAGLRSGETVSMQWLLGHRLARIGGGVRQPSGLPDGRSRQGASERRLLAAKHQEPLFGVVGRIAVWGAERRRARDLVAELVQQLRAAESPGARLRVRRLPSWWVARRMSEYQMPSLAWPLRLNAAELACLLCWPIGGPVVAGLHYTGRRLLPFGSGSVLPSRVGESGWRAPHRVLGVASSTEAPGLVNLRADDALRHLHVIGPTGVGKSTLLANLILQDIEAGRSVVVIEPKGDLVADVLDRIPAARHRDVVLLDPADVARPVGLNVLSAATETNVDAVVHLFRSIFSSSSYSFVRSSKRNSVSFRSRSTSSTPAFSSVVAVGAEKASSLLR